MDAASTLAVSSPVVLTSAQSAPNSSAQQTSSTGFQSVYHSLSNSHAADHRQEDLKTQNSRAKKGTNQEPVPNIAPVTSPSLNSNLPLITPLALTLPINTSPADKMPRVHDTNTTEPAPVPPAVSDDVATAGETPIPIQVPISATVLPWQSAVGISGTPALPANASKTVPNSQARFQQTNDSAAAGTVESPQLPAARHIPASSRNLPTPSDPGLGTPRETRQPIELAPARTTAVVAPLQVAVSPQVELQKPVQQADDKAATSQPQAVAAASILPDEPKVETSPASVQGPQLKLANPPVNLKSAGEIATQSEPSALVQPPAPSPTRTAQPPIHFAARSENLAFTLNISETAVPPQEALAAAVSWPGREPIEPTDITSPSSPRQFIRSAPATLPHDASTIRPSAPLARALNRILDTAGSLLPRTEGPASSLRLSTIGSTPAPFRQVEQQVRAFAPPPPRLPAPTLSPDTQGPLSDKNIREPLRIGSDFAWNTPTGASYADARPLMPQADATQPPPGSQPQPLDSVQPVPVEATQPRVSGQILLHVGTKDQASAAVRISDRAGSVNVSVHAADPELRNSLRSSLGELTSQLNEQGWKTDVVKTPVAPAPAQSDNKPDSGSQGNRSFSQHHHSGDNDRQPHRDRRAQPNWLDEFEQQTSSNTANSGGTN